MRAKGKDVGFGHLGHFVGACGESEGAVRNGLKFAEMREADWSATPEERTDKAR